jgi:hypothetical protein
MQGRQLARPISFWYFPCSQSVQLCSSGIGEYLPAEQTSQEMELIAFCACPENQMISESVVVLIVVVTQVKAEPQNKKKNACIRTSPKVIQACIFYVIKRVQPTCMIKSSRTWQTHVTRTLIGQWLRPTTWTLGAWAS